ncbi:hypothetical protein JG687_00015238 [Phytophthora cactorum]|uniref:Uncharacterized protein n=1 Tax=Phytophthora cactorum TaxID=29920 RepID=A0A8T1TZE3_9STRA|nr:hypothetical protein JG687_00015238 [Phytophthora cactorum]
MWDSMREHISKAVKAKCSARNIAMCVVPGGLTSYLQAGDIGIYKSFKDLSIWRSTPGNNRTKSSTLASVTLVYQSSTRFAVGSSARGATRKSPR